MTRKYTKYSVVRQYYDRNGNVIKTTYNPFGKVLTQKVTKSDGTSETITNTYDILGNIKSMTDSTGTTKYEYDALNVGLSMMCYTIGQKISPSCRKALM